jgi:hypothetical protein
MGEMIKGTRERSGEMWKSFTVIHKGHTDDFVVLYDLSLFSTSPFTTTYIINY